MSTRTRLSPRIPRAHAHAQCWGRKKEETECMLGDRRWLGHEKEAVCIVTGGGVCEEINAGWVAENKVVCTVSGMRIWGDQRLLGYEIEAACTLWGGVCEQIHAGWVAENKEVCIVSGMRI